MATSPHEQALRAADLISGLPLKEVEARLRRGLHQADQGKRALAFYLADLSDHDVTQLAGYHSMHHFAEAKLDLEPRRTRELIRVGQKLLELPAIDQAFLEGRIGWAKVVSLASVVTPEHEEAWLALAGADITCRELDREIARARPGGPPRDTNDRKGLSQKRFRISAKVGAVTRTKIEHAKRKLADERGGPLSEAEFLDAMADLVLRVEADGSIPGFKRVPSSLYRIVVRPHEGDLLVNTETLGEIPLGPSTAATVRCDAEVMTVDDNPPAKDRPTPDWLRAKVLARDGCRCRCCGSHHELHVHHIQFRAHGGCTKVHNLITLCERCHGLVHEKLLFLRGERAGEVVLVDADGARVTPAAVHRLSTAVPPPKPPIDRSVQPSILRFEDLPASADGAWWRRHASLIRMKSGAALEFVDGRPAEEEEKTLGPVSLEPDTAAFRGLVGQDARLERLAFTAEGSRARGLPFPHTLLEGPAGTGKTTLAERLARFLGRRLVRTSGPLLQDVHALLRMLGDLGEEDVLFVDEIHAVPRVVLEALYEAMAQGQVSLTFEAGVRARAVRLQLPPFTLLAATTEGHAIHEALLGRFGLRESLGFHDVDALGTLVTARAESQGVTLRPDAAARLARFARGTPREALRLVDRVLDDAAASRRTSAARPHVDVVLRRLGFDGHGLAPDEQRYIALLRESAVPIPLLRLARLLGQTVDTVANRIEPFLFRMGLVMTTARGRVALSIAQPSAV